MSIRATLNCEAFADAHRGSAHYDQSSFVGLAWRPEGESCCVGTLAHTCTVPPHLQQWIGTFVIAPGLNFNQRSNVWMCSRL